MTRSAGGPFAALSLSPGARACYDPRRAAADSHEAALRRVASKLIGQLHHCLAHRVLHDEQAARGKSLNNVPQAA